MRKLNELLRSLSKFLHDPAGHVTAAWSLVRGAIPQDAVASQKGLRDALVVVDSVVTATVYFLGNKAEEPEAGDAAADKAEG